MRSSRLVKRASLALAAAAFALIAAGPAQAEVDDVFSASFGAATSTPPNPYPLGGHGINLAVDNSGGPSDGDIYVTDPSNARVEKFSPAGALLLMFGQEVNKTKSESLGSTPAERDVCAIGSGDICQNGVESEAVDSLRGPFWIAVDSSNGPSAGDVYVGTNIFNFYFVYKYSPSGQLIGSWGEHGRIPFFGVEGIQVNKGDLYVSTFNFLIKRLNQAGEELGFFTLPGRPNNNTGFFIDSFGNFYDLLVGEAEKLGTIKISGTGSIIAQITNQSPNPNGLAIDPESDDLYVEREDGLISHFDSYCGNLCTPFDTLGPGHGVFDRIAFGVSERKVYVSSLEPSFETQSIDVFDHVGPKVSPGTFVGADETSADVKATVDPAGHGPVTSCNVDYGPTAALTFTESTPCTPDPASSPPGSNFAGPQEVTAHITGLAPGSPYRYRVVAGNATAKTNGLPKAFQTASAPSVNSFTTANVTATSADLIANVEPHGANTKYRFEYGPSTAYGSLAPVPDGEITEDLFGEHKVVTHLENLQVGVIYHFRLVTENQYGTVETNDQSFGFYPPKCPNQAIRQVTGANNLPDCRGYELVTPPDSGNALIFPSGTTPMTGRATTPSRLAYVTWGGVIPGINGMPPNSTGDMEVATRTSTGWVSKYIGLPSTVSFNTGGPPIISDNFLAQPDKVNEAVISNSSLSRVVDWNDGEWATVDGYNQEGPGAYSSNAPYVWDTNTGEQVDRWPTNLGAVPKGESFQGLSAASADLSHFAFTSDVSFAPGGEPGDAYDNNTATGQMSVISRLQSGQHVKATPFKLSADGSRILMLAPAIECGGTHFNWSCSPSISEPVELLMRVDDTVTYQLAPGQKVSYVGTTEDASKVFFTTAASLVSEDIDHSTDLYMWSEEGAKAGEPLTLISLGNGGTTGNTDCCNAAWTTKCGVLPIKFEAYSKMQGGLGGNGVADTSIAAHTGDIYFFSPEKLAGAQGLAGGSNLYVYREGSLQFVSTFESANVCTVNGQGSTTCAESPISRMNISPDGRHVAFIAVSKLTNYDNAGFTEVYSYEPATGKINCDSCLPDGSPPKHEVRGSQNGLFMTDDGRTFFTTSDALVPQDTNETEDVYEFDDGRPQLITSGTSAANEEFGFIGIETFPGLVGVSADGTDVYFATFDVLVGQDQNGEELKIYDARSGGGFPFVNPAPECAAADECHGAGAAAMATPSNGSGAHLGAGNFSEKSQTSHGKQKRHKRHHKKPQRHKKHGGSTRGGGNG